MVYRTVMKYILPELMRGAINDAQERMRQQQQRSQPAGPEITNTQKETKPLQGGEYIDYEEVK
jgi:hypothetical protein